MRPQTPEGEEREETLIQANIDSCGSYLAPVVGLVEEVLVATPQVVAQLQVLPHPHLRMAAGEACQNTQYNIDVNIFFLTLCTQMKSNL